MSTNRINSDKFLQHLHAVIGQAQNTNGLISIPNILIPRAWLSNTKSTEPDIEDMVLDWFMSLGLHGDRTKRGVNDPGYPGLFRELIDPPPWIEITMDDSKGNISPERVRKIEPLYTLAVQGIDLEGEYQLYLKRSRRQLTEWKLPKLSRQAQIESLNADEFADQMSLEHFRELLFLSHMLGSDLIADLSTAVMDEERLLPASGAPDLFLWSWDSTQLFWVFAEVKGPQDHLRSSQYEWIAGNWTSIQGHIVVVSII